MLKNWTIAIRPKTLLASISPIILGQAMAYFYLSKLNITVAFFSILTALFLQIGSNLANDYLDSLKGIDNESRLGPSRVTQLGLISPKEMKKALIFFLTLALIFGSYLMWIGGPVIILFGLLSLYFAYGYSGGPFPLSHHGLGEISALLFFGIIAVSGSTYLQTFHFDLLSFILGIGVGHLAALIMAINNLRDIHTDKKTAKKTLAVIFGETFQRRLCLFLIINSSFIVLLVAYFYNHPYLYLITLLPLFFIKTWRSLYLDPIDKKMNTHLKNSALYLFIYCLFLSINFILSPMINS